jgi:3-oxoacyl-[acyl-carrier-protein] synthase-3
VFAFDINATCLSFLVAFDYAATMIASGRIEKALVVSSEMASRALPWDHDPETAAMFGDGAAAAVLGRGDDSAQVVAARFETYPAGYRFCELPAGGTRFDFYNDRANYEKGLMFTMDGRNVFRLTTQVIRPFMARVLAESGLKASELDVIVPHQASRGGVDHVMRKLGFTDGRTVDILAEHGNQVAASLPTALHIARMSGKIVPGSKVLLLGTSAGLSLGAVVFVA